MEKYSQRRYHFNHQIPLSHTRSFACQESSKDWQVELQISIKRRLTAFKDFSSHFN